MWLENSIFYQIYPLGFCGVKEGENEGAADILKIIDFIPHLKKLSVNTLILNPVFESDNHGYDTKDYSMIDKRLGTNGQFKSVCDALHQNGIRIVLDGVFNHVGRNFMQFLDVLENRQNSRYKDWFIINFDGNSNYNDGLWYEGWEGHFELVKLNLKNPEVCDFLIEKIKGWINEFDIDGLRLDVAYSLDFDFMRRMRRELCGLKADFALIGEVLFGDYNQIVNDEMLHSCTNYECYKGLYSSCNDYNLYEISHSLNRQYGGEDWCLYRGKQLMTFVDNHDVARIASILKDKNHLSLVYSLLFAMPGIPCIYYGSEWGEEGEKRKDSDWNLRPYFEEPKENGLTELISKLCTIRTTSVPLSRGGYRNVVIDNKALLLCREYDGEKVYLAVNIGSEEKYFDNGELSGNFEKLVSYETNGKNLLEENSVTNVSMETNMENGMSSDETQGDFAKTAHETINLSGNLKLPGYSFVFLKKL